MTKDNITFGDIFSKSWDEYRNNFKESLKFIFLFIGIPALIFLFVEVVLLIVDKNLFLTINSSLSSAALTGQAVKTPLYFRILSIFFNIVSIFLMVFVSAGFISTTLKKDKFSFGDLVKNAKPRYWQYFLFSIVMIIFLLLLTLLLIIPGIIFGIYWIFASYVFFDRKEKILPSLKQSRYIVRRRWWKTLGYLLLLGLILIGFILLLNIIQLPLTVIMVIHTLSSTKISLGLFIASTILGSIVNFLASVISIPLSTIFIKNFYRSMEKTQVKAENKVKKSKK